MLRKNTKEAILALQQQYPMKRSALIPALHLAQRELGYLPRTTQDEVATLFDIVPNEVHALVTFYDMFFDEPVGQHIIHVCKNVSCMLRGCDPLLAALCEKLQIAPGQTTSDGAFTVITSECLAACDRAPMMLVDDEVVGPIAPEELDDLLADLRKHPGHTCTTDHAGERSHG
jgi:NADH-quinone oxidoreductase subunit E